MADVIWVRGENGALQVFDVPLPPGIRHRLDRGDLVRVNEDGSPWAEPDGEDAEPDGEDAEPEDMPPPDAPALPDRRASRAVWTEFAVSQGMDRAQAAGMSKADLVAEFTAERNAA